MRATLSRMAGVKPSRYLTPGSKTGLAGIYTHESPRSALLFLYSTTLDKIKAAPEQSVYRQSVEAVTKHRMAIVEAVKPEGYAEWQDRINKLVKEYPDHFAATAKTRRDGNASWSVERNGTSFIILKRPRLVDDRHREWDGELNEGSELEGARSADERKDQVLSATRTSLEEPVPFTVEPEPALTADQYVPVPV